LIGVTIADASLDADGLSPLDAVSGLHGPKRKRPPTLAERERVEREDRIYAGLDILEEALEAEAQQEEATEVDDTENSHSNRFVVGSSRASEGDDAAAEAGAHAARYANWPLKDVKEPTENDVLYGRGPGIYNRPGNKRYRKWVQEAQHKRLDKRVVALEIVRKVREQSPPGRFLKLDKKRGMWNDVGDNAAWEKTSRALGEFAPVVESTGPLDYSSLRRRLRKYLDLDPSGADTTAVGMPNLGNTCFMNASIRLLSVGGFMSALSHTHADLLRSHEANGMPAPKLPLTAALLRVASVVGAPLPGRNDRGGEVSPLLPSFSKRFCLSFFFLTIYIFSIPSYLPMYCAECRS